MDIPINDVQTVRERLQKESESITYNGTLKKQRNITPLAYKNLKVRQYKGKRMLDLTLGSIALIICGSSSKFNSLSSLPNGKIRSSPSTVISGRPFIFFAEVCRMVLNL